jgi:hypothetical protein
MADLDLRPLDPSPSSPTPLRWPQTAPFINVGPAHVSVSHSFGLNAYKPAPAERMKILSPARAPDRKRSRRRAQPPRAARPARAGDSQERARAVGRSLDGIPALRAGDRRARLGSEHSPGEPARPVVRRRENGHLLSGVSGRRRAGVEGPASRLRAGRGTWQDQGRSPPPGPQGTGDELPGNLCAGAAPRSLQSGKAHAASDRAHFSVARALDPQGLDRARVRRYGRRRAPDGGPVGRQRRLAPSRRGQHRASARHRRAAQRPAQAGRLAAQGRDSRRARIGRGRHRRAR